MERRNKKTKSVGNGEGSLYKSEALNCLVFQYVEPSGKRKTMKQKKNETVKEFKARITKTKNELNNGTYVEKSKDTGLEIIKNYVEQKHSDGITSDRTYIRDLETIKQLEKTCNKKTGIDRGKRTFPMTTNVRKIIEKLLSNKITNINNLLFWDYNKNRMITDGMINSYLDRINKIDKIHSITNRLFTHRLRHTFITRCQEKGMPLVVIQSLVGHVEGSTITNDTYTSVSLDFMKQELEKII